LIGERGREVKEFIEDSLGEEGMARSVIVCSTGDKPPLIRQKCLLTATAVVQTNKSTKIKENRKQALNYNNIISTVITIVGGYFVDGLIKKPAGKFVEKFKKLNAGNPNLAKCVEGINILRPAIIFATIYYGVLPVFSTYLSEKTDKYIAKHKK
jgi:hypothetical protein